MISTHTSTVISDGHRNRDSGTSSPQPNTSQPIDDQPPQQPQQPQQPRGTLSVECFASRRRQQRTEEIIETEADDELSDSNDSVFSSASSIDSNHPDQGLSELDMRDIYLGGSCVTRTTWRKRIAIPMLGRHKITYHLPKLHESLNHTDAVTDLTDVERNHKVPATNALDTSSSNDSGISIGGSGKKRVPQMRLISATTTAHFSETLNGATTASVHSTHPRKNMFNEDLLDSSRVLLFVITNETRSLAPMTLAAYCIGLGYNVVLCVQMLANDCVIGADTVSRSL